MIEFIVPVHDEKRYLNNICRSAIFTPLSPYAVFRKMCGYDNVRVAFNAGKSISTAKYLAFCHEDVFMPTAFESQLVHCIERIEKEDPNFGVLGFAGIRHNPEKEWVMSVNDRGNIYGYRADERDEIVEVSTIDELCLITKNEGWVSFDESAPNRHLYGAELCLKARSLGKKNYIIPAHLHHNGNSYGYYDMMKVNKELIEAADYLKSTNPGYFPFSTTCMEFR